MRSLYTRSACLTQTKHNTLQSTEHYFRAVFKLPYEQDPNKKVSRRKTDPPVFSGTLETDGVSLCVHFYRKARDEEKTKEDDDEEEATPGRKRVPTPHVYIPPEQRVIANDPGRNTIFYGVEETEGGRHFRRFTRNQYYNTAQLNRSRRKSERWQEKDPGVKAALEAMSGVTLKTSKLLISFLCV